MASLCGSLIPETMVDGNEWTGHPRGIFQKKKEKKVRHSFYTLFHQRLCYEKQMCGCSKKQDDKKMQCAYVAVHMAFYSVIWDFCGLITALSGLNLPSVVSIPLCKRSFWGCKWGGNCYVFICNPTMSSSWPSLANNVLHVVQNEVYFFRVSVFAMQSAFPSPFVWLCMVCFELIITCIILHATPANPISHVINARRQCTPQKEGSPTPTRSSPGTNTT